MADWIQNYPGVAELLQQEGDVLEGIRQDEEQSIAAPRLLWEQLPHQAEQGCVVTPPPNVWMPASNRALGIRWAYRASPPLP